MSTGIATTSTTYLQHIKYNTKLMLILNPFQNSFRLQTILTARFASCTRQRIDGYASSQELAKRTRQDGFRLRKEF